MVRRTGLRNFYEEMPDLGGISLSGHIEILYTDGWVHDDENGWHEQSAPARALPSRQSCVFAS